jgi:dynein intermediate chain 1
LADNKKEAFLYGLAGGMCFDFNKTYENLFLVGTEEGYIHLCSKAYSGQYLETYKDHYLAVYAVKWNNYHPKTFLSCSADWTIKMWLMDLKRPIVSYDLGNPVGDIAWSPYSSTVFAKASCMFMTLTRTSTSTCVSSQPQSAQRLFMSHSTTSTPLF